jgi:hypothetical protein
MSDLAYLSKEVTQPEEFAARLQSIATEYAVALRNKDYQTALQVAYLALSSAAGMANMAYLQLQVQLQAAASLPVQTDDVAT